MGKKLKHACSLHLSFFWSEFSCWLESELALPGLPSVSLWLCPWESMWPGRWPRYFENNWTGHTNFLGRLWDHSKQRQGTTVQETFVSEIFSMAWVDVQLNVLLGIKSWLCHVNPKEEAAWSRVAPGAEEASHHAPGTGWSLYSLGPSGGRSQCWPLTCFLGGETQHMKGTEETPSLMELFNTWRCCPLLQSVFIGAGSLCLLNQRRISFESRNKTEPVLWYVWRGVKTDCRKKPQLKKCQWV